MVVKNVVFKVERDMSVRSCNPKMTKTQKVDNKIIEYEESELMREITFNEEIERIEILYEKFKDHVPAAIGKKRPESPMRPDRRPDPVMDSPKNDAERDLMKNLPFRSLLQAMMQMTTCMSMKTCLNLIARCQSTPGIINWTDLIRALCYMYDHRHEGRIMRKTTDRPTLDV